MNTKKNQLSNKILEICGYILLTLGILSLLAKIIVNF